MDLPDDPFCRAIRIPNCTPDGYGTATIICPAGQIIVALCCWKSRGQLLRMERDLSNQLPLGPYLETDTLAAWASKWAGRGMLWVSHIFKIVTVEPVRAAVGLLKWSAGDLGLAQ